MRPRFPLYAKILLCFFLNLGLVALVLALIFRVQFRLGLDWLLAGDAADRVEAVSHLLLGELREHPHVEWDSILERFSRAYQVAFFLFGPRADQLAGQRIGVPPELQVRLLQHRPRRPPSPPLPRREPDPLAAARLPPPPPGAPGHASPEEPHPKSIVRTSSPTRYWILVRGDLARPEDVSNRPVTLVAMSNSLSGGGLLFDSKPWLMAGAVVLLVSGLLWLPLVRGITRSIRQITDATGQIAAGKFDVRVVGARNDELGILTTAINQMAARLAGYVEGQKRFLGDVAHELCSPLARLQVALGILDQHADDRERKYLAVASDKAQQMGTLINELLSFSKAGLSPPVRLGPVALSELVAAAVEREGDSQARIEIDVPSELIVLGDFELLLRAVSNLLRNAIRYASSAEPITVSARGQGDGITLTVADSGPGVPDEHLPKLFDPFYRVDTSRDRLTGGVGLGLTIVKTCVEACNGEVSCRNRRPHGLEVTVKLQSQTK